MGLLSKAVKTTSYQSWQDMDGAGNAIVQRRTADGLGKNRTAAHRLAFGATDMFPFRIIVVSGATAGLSFDASSPGAVRDHEGNVRMRDATKHVIAAGQSKQEILKDWSDLRSFTDAAAIAGSSWPATYKHVQFQKRNAFGDNGTAITGRTALSPGASVERSRGALGSPEPSSPTTGLRGSVTQPTPMTKSDAASPQAKEPAPAPLAASKSATSLQSRPSERYQEAQAPPVDSLDVGSPPSTGVVKRRAADDTPVQPATHSEQWLMRVARLWDGSAMVATVLVVVALVATAVQGISCPPLILGIPVLVGSMLRVDPATRKSKDRIDRLARTLRVSPSVRLLGHRQRAANFAASLTVLHFTVSVFLQPHHMDLLYSCVASLAAATMLLFAVRAGSGETRDHWHQRMEVAERVAKRAADDATNFVPSVDPSVSLQNQSSNSTAAAAAASAAAAEPSMFGDAALDPCLVPVGPDQIPDVACRVLELIAGSEPGVKWSKPANAHGCSIQTTKTPWCASPASMFKTSFDGVRALSVYQCLYDDPTGVKGRASYAFQIEEMLAERYLIRRVGRNEGYWYAAINSKFPGIAGRDFVNKVAPCTVLSKESRAKYGISDSPAFIYAAGPYAGDGAPAPNPPFVRAQMHRYGVLIQDRVDGSGCNVTMAVSLDPAGNVPSAAVAFANRDTAKKLRVLDSFVHNWEHSHALPPRLPDGTAASAQAIADNVMPGQPTSAAKSAAVPKAQQHQQQSQESKNKTAAAAGKDDGAVEGQVVTPDTIVKGMELMKETGWERRGEKDGCTWDGKAVPYCKAEACLNRLFMEGVHAANFCAYNNDDDSFTRKDSNAFKLDDLLQAREIVGTDSADPNHTLRVLFTFKSPFFGIGPRDFANRYTRKYFLSEDEKARFGVGHPGCDVLVEAAVPESTIPERKKFVRGSTHRFMLIVADREDDSGCDVTQVLANDAGGSLPISIINALAADNMNKLAKRYKLFKELEAKDGRMEKKAAPVSSNSDAAAAASRDERPEAPSAPKVEPIPYKPRDGQLPAAFAKALELWRKKDWKDASSKEGATQKAMPSPYCGKDALWMTTKAQGATLDDFDVAINDDRSTLRPKDAPFKYDELLDKKEATQHDTADGPGSMVLHSMFVTPSRFVAPRDTVTLLYHREALSQEHQESMKDLFKSSTGRVLACAAVDASDEVPVKSPYVRGCTHIFSLWAVEQADGVELHLVMSFDPCGSIPGALVKTANAAQLTKVLLMRQLVLAAAADRKAKGGK